MKIVPEAPTEFTRGGLIEGIFVGRKARLYRVIEWDEQLDCIWLIEIMPSRPQGAMPVEWVFSAVRAAIGVTARFVPETVALPSMRLAKASLPRKARSLRNFRLRLLGSLIWRINHRLLCDRKKRAALLKTRSEKTGKRVSFLHKLLSQYLWFGMTWNALLPLDENRGPRGQSPRTGTAKTGRPNSHRKLGRSYAGVNVEKTDLIRFNQALHEFYVDQNMSLHATYEAMVQLRYTRVRTIQGKAVSRPISAERIPTYNQFYYHARKIIDSHGLKAQKVGALDFAQHHSTYSGNSTDFAMYPGDVFDGDCTTFKVECQLFTGEKHSAIRLKTIAFWIDRSSYAITGFYAFSGPESWDVYRHALFVAFTSKEEICKAAGVDPKLWNIRHKCNKIFVDRGPARGDQAYSALINRLGLGRAVAPPRAAHMKSAVENLNRLLQQQMETMPGGKRRTKGIRDQDNYDNVIKGPLMTSRELNDCLVRAIVQHNNFMNASHLLTSPMLRDGVAPNPAAIFEWGIRNAAGSHGRLLSDTEVYSALLNSRTVSVQAEGIKLHGAWFQCDEIRAYRHAKFKGRRSPLIEVLFDPLRLVLYWTNEDREIVCIPMKKASAAKFEEMDFMDIAEYKTFERASVVTQNLKKLNHRLLSTKQVQVAISAAERFARTSPQEQKNGIANSRVNKARERKYEEAKLRETHRKMMGGFEKNASTPPAQSVAADSPPPTVLASETLEDDESPRAMLKKLMAQRKNED